MTRLLLHVRGVVTDHRKWTPLRIDPLRFGDLLIDARSREVYLGNRRVHLTRKEFDLLAVMASEAGRTLTRVELLRRVWGPMFEGSSSTLTVHIRRLRRKIEHHPRSPKHIITVWNEGYRFQP